MLLGKYNLYSALSAHAAVLILCLLYLRTLRALSLEQHHCPTQRLLNASALSSHPVHVKSMSTPNMHASCIHIHTSIHTFSTLLYGGDGIHMQAVGLTH